MCFSAYSFLSSLFEENLYRSNEETKGLKDCEVKYTKGVENNEIRELQFEQEYEYYDYENDLINAKNIENSNKINIKINNLEISSRII